MSGQPLPYGTVGVNISKNSKVAAADAGGCTLDFLAMFKRLAAAGGRFAGMNLLIEQVQRYPDGGNLLQGKR